MPSGVSVEKSAVQGGINCCKKSIQELNSAASGLNRSYQQAGASGWRDQKYTDLGRIVGECCTALKKPVAQLESCKQKLNALLQAIIEYENQNL